MLGRWLAVRSPVLASGPPSQRAVASIPCRTERKQVVPGTDLGTHVRLFYAADRQAETQPGSDEFAQPAGNRMSMVPRLPTLGEQSRSNEPKASAHFFPSWRSMLADLAN